jgi:hypothetical protein
MSVAPFLYLGRDEPVKMGWLVVLASVLLWCEGSEAERHAISTWPSTASYLGFADFEAATDGRIYLATGGQYTLYLDGELVGTGTGAQVLDQYEVSFGRNSNNLALVIDHDGTDAPYGFFLAIEADGQLLISSPADRTTPWLWTGFDLPVAEGASWMELRFNRLSRHEEDGQPVIWTPVQEGTLDRQLLASLDNVDLTRLKSAAGYPGGLDGGRGSLQLRSLEGVNTAFNSFSGDPNLVDGDINTSVNFRRGASALLQNVETDLGRQVTINRVRVLTEPPSQGSFADVSVRGYSIFVSKDGVDFIEVGSVNAISNFRETEVIFPAINARHVRLVITDFSARDASPRVGEMEVYGSGVVPEGIFRSLPLDLGMDASKNFDRVLRHGEVPSGAEMELRFRSGDDGVAWSPWSAWSGGDEVELVVPEPRRLLQFEARMSTLDLVVGPRLDSLEVLFDAGPVPAAVAEAWISPALVPIGEDVDFTYGISLQIGPEEVGVERLAILTQWPAQVNFAGVEGLDNSVVDLARSYAKDDSLVIVFDPPITVSSELKIPFTGRLLAASHQFTGLIFAPGSSNALRTAERQGIDPLTNEPYVLEAVSLDFAIPLLQDVAPMPPVFTPNGDGINDEVFIGFTLARVAGALVRVEIYDLAGRLLRLLPEARLAAGRYSRGGHFEPGRWDGRDDEGQKVAPGLYLYRLVVELDPDDEISSGIIGVAW